MGSLTPVNSFIGKHPNIRAFPEQGLESGIEVVDNLVGCFLIDHSSRVNHGRLENGLVYYVRWNSKPNRRAALALAVQAGSVLEKEEERGVAHIIEHLAFRATKNYENHGIVKFVESIGGEYGAQTFPDETVYELLVPIDKDKPELLSQAISILAEFSTEIRIADEDLEKERGVVMEEYRSKRTAALRTEEARWTLLMEGSEYTERLPFGSEKVIRGVTSETVKQFYQKWYHLSRMAVIAVGDFPDTESVVELIKTHFSQKTSASNPSSVSYVPVPSHEQPRYSCFVDSEATGSQVLISYKMPANKMKTLKDSLLESVFLTALKRRFFKISHRKNSPYFSCSLNAADITRSVRAFTMHSICKEKEILKALESMLTEVARVRLHGFSKREISTARIQTRSEITAYLKRDQRESTSLRNDYLQQFIRKEPVIGNYGPLVASYLLRNISASDVSRYAEKLQTSCSCVILTVEPRASATINDLREAVLKVSELEKDGSISQVNNEKIPKEIVDSTPNSGNILHWSENSNIGAIELILSNGMKVCYKRTNFLRDQILFSGLSKGGLSELSESEYLSSKMGASFAQGAGEFGHKPSVLADMLAAKKVSVRTEVGNYFRTFSGDCSPSNLETALQLVYQLFTKNITLEEEEWNLVMQKKEAEISADERDPFTPFRNRETQLHFGDSYFFRPLRRSDRLNIDSFHACEYFNSSFSDPSTFTVVIVGNIDPEAALPLIQQYLGGIPKPSEPICHLKCDYIKGLPFNFPTTIVREVVYSPMKEEQCQVALSFPVELMKETLGEEKGYLYFMQELFKRKILQVLRFERGQIYSAGVSYYLNGDKPCRTDTIRGYIRIAFSCDPKMYSVLVDIALDEISHLREEGPSDQEFSTILEIQQRSYENVLQDNNSWLNDILDIYYSGINFDDVGPSFKVHERLSSIRESFTQFKIQSAMRRILPFARKKQYTAVILLPQTYKSH